jgi:hypothetical protein
MAVRRRDLRGPAWYGPVPGLHGAAGDPRYPSPRTLRGGIAFTVDFLLHAAGAIGIAIALGHVPRLATYAVAGGVGAFLVLSFAHRVFAQWAFRATLGKALCGLCLIRDDTGGRPRLWPLTRDWLLGIFAVLAFLS